MSVFRHPAAALDGKQDRNYWGDKSDGDIRLTIANGAEQSFDGGATWSPIPGWTNDAGVIGVPSVQDGDTVVVNCRNLYRDDGTELTTTHRCRGLLVYVYGDLHGNSKFSMVARGCRANPDDTVATQYTPVPPSDGNPVSEYGIRIAKFAAGFTDSGASDFSGCGLAAVAAEGKQKPVESGLVIDIPKIGGAGAPKSRGGDGADGSTVGNGSGGGAAGGGDTQGGSLGLGGKGTPGTCFTGGVGAGAGGHTPTLDGGDAEPYGNKGGDSGYPSSSQYPAGTGNPSGNGNGNEGTGGLLVVMVRGDIYDNADFVVDGTDGLGNSNGYGAGASGAGIAILLYAGEIIGVVTMSAKGGIGGKGFNNVYRTDGGKAGDGTTIVQKIDR